MEAVATATTDYTEEDDGLPVGRLWRQYTDFTDSKAHEIEEMRSARHYYHCDQWTKEEVAELKRRRQPIITANKIGRKIDAVVGLVERMRQDPKAFPRTPRHEEGAEVATATLMYALDVCRWEDLSPECAQAAAINGVGGVELFLEPGDQGDPEVGMRVVDPDTFFYDPRSFRPDFSDARYMGVAKWLDIDEAKEMFPEKAEELEAMANSTGAIESWQQQDRERRWVNLDARQVFVIEHWYRRGGEWRWCFYVGTSVKLASGISPFVNEKGQSDCRFIMFSAAVDHDGDRYGFVRNMKSPQDEINARRSKALHIMNTRRLIGIKGAVDDVEKTRKEWARPDGYVEINMEGGVVPDPTTQSEFQHQIAFLEEAKTEIENFGPNPALIGQGIENKSGRAIALLQQAGIAELGPYILAYRGWKLRVYRAVWNAIQHHWTQERWVRVTDDEGLAQFIGLNQVQMDEYGRPQLVNALGSLDVDIILDEGPDTTSLMESTHETLMALAQSGAPVPPQVIIETSSLPSSVKKKIIGMLQPPEPDPLERAAAEAEVQNTQADTAAKKARALKDMGGAMGDFRQAFEPPQPPTQADMRVS